MKFGLAAASLVKRAFPTGRSIFARNMLYRLGSEEPQVDKDAWVAPNASVMGKVKLEKGSSVWFNTTIRGDNELITVGENSNVQDGCVLHSDMGVPLTIGKNVTVGHMVMLHGCEIGDNTLIGIGSIILNNTTIGKNCLIGANTLIPENKTIPDNSMVMGSPGKVVKTLNEDQIQGLSVAAAGYVANSKRFRSDLHPIESSKL
mmetsp:Transcript_37445/g.73217  ORF Transcript_37445/g.73217 Transcript_37445/m.73217 type:complete len:203 (-) Transcript_37445:418-1026(-)